jgi:hypothetical protein
VSLCDYTSALEAVYLCVPISMCRCLILKMKLYSG